MEKTSIRVPSVKDFAKLADNVKEGMYPGKKCMSACRGCQCNKSPVLMKSIFETDEFFAPNSGDYASILGKIHDGKIHAASAGGCPCNCSKCNRCRCDCACTRRSYEGNQTYTIW